MAIPYGAAPSAPYGQKRDGHPDGQRAFDHPLPSAYMAKEGRERRTYGPFGHPLRVGGAYMTK